MSEEEVLVQEENIEELTLREILIRTVKLQVIASEGEQRFTEVSSEVN